MKFLYSAKNTEGQVVSGAVEAVTKESAIGVLQQSGLVILKMDKAEEKKWHERAMSLFRRAGLKDISILTRQLATLFEAQVTITDALQTIMRQTTNEILRNAMFEVYTDIQSGLSFSEALGKQGHVFSPFYVNMVKASEFTGKLSETLSYLADYYETEETVNKKVVNAMIYPAFILVLFVVVIAIMVSVVIPQLKTVILDSGVPQEQLPLTTQILFGAGDFFSKYYLIVIVLFGAGVYGIVQYLRSEEGKMMFSTLMLKVPVIGSFLRQLYVSRFCRTFSVLLDGAIPVAQALEIAGDVIGNAYYQDVIYIVAEGVRQGEPISDVLARYADYFPPLVSQMIAIGEKTGRMSDLLKKVSQFYNREVESMVNSLAELIQPVLIVGVGILIAGLIAAIIMPIYQIAQQF